VLKSSWVISHVNVELKAKGFSCINAELKTKRFSSTLTWLITREDFSTYLKFVLVSITSNDSCNLSGYVSAVNCLRTNNY
jgi:hypothetical protein